MVDTRRPDGPNGEQVTDILLNGIVLEPAEVAALAGNARAKLRLHPTAVAHMAASAKLRRDFTLSGQPVYGVTTGFGASVRCQISADRAAALQRNLISYHLNGTGPASSVEVVRATMIIRANCLARGVSGVRVELIELLLDLIRHDILPVIPERGSVGASGDLVPLCYLANVIIGEGEVSHRGGPIRPAGDVLAECGLTPLRLEPKEGLALINGTSFMAGFATVAWADARHLAFAADLCTALTCQVLGGNRDHFHEFPHRHKPYPGQITSAQTIRTLLTGDQLTTDHTVHLKGLPLGDEGFRELGYALQDPYSLRCAPHVIGVLRDTLDWVENWLRVEINSSNDNPLFDIDEVIVHNAGNFYGGHVAQAMDALKTAVANIGDLLDRQLQLIVDEKFNRGLTPNLIARREPDDPELGLHHGFKGMQIACSAFTAEALKFTMPASVFSRSTEAHNQDKVSMGSIAARDARTVVELVRDVTAVHLLALCQAMDLRDGESFSPAARVAHQLVRELSPFLGHDRRLDGDLAAVADLITSGRLRTECENASILLRPEEDR